MSNYNAQLPAAPRPSPDILRWIPSRWDQFVANRRAIHHLQRIAKSVRSMAESGSIRDLANMCCLMTGHSRTGKTALMKFLVRCIVCNAFDHSTLTPCGGTCSTCRQNPSLSGLQGLFSTLTMSSPECRAQVPVHFTPIDCTMIASSGDLRARLFTLSPDFEGIRIFFFDEVHRLAKHGMEEMLLKTIEEKQALWFFSTAKPEELEDMFKNRLLRISTELPTIEEMAGWLADRCNEWGIAWEEDAIIRVVEKSNRIAGVALHALALAALDESGLTRELVENDWIVK